MTDTTHADFEAWLDEPHPLNKSLTPRAEIPKRSEWFSAMVWQAATLAAQGKRQPQWLPISDAPEGEMVVVFWIDPDGHPGEQERHEFEKLEDGCWLKWEEQCEHFSMIAKGGDVEWIGPSGTAPYTHFKRLGSPLPPTATPQGNPND